MAFPSLLPALFVYVHHGAHFRQHALKQSEKSLETLLPARTFARRT
jgi:hypothetical protein